MLQGNRGASWLATALTSLLVMGFAGATRLVLCLGPDGHRALELAHPGMECSTLASSRNLRGTSLEPLAECLDLPASGAGPSVVSSLDPDRLPTPAAVPAAASPEPASPGETAFAAPVAARAGPVPLARHLRSTVLRV